jgi:hypothetical protein
MEESWKEEDVLTENKINIEDENISTLMAIIHEAQIEGNDVNPYAKAYRSRREAFTPVQGRSLSQQYAVLSQDM